MKAYCDIVKSVLSQGLRKSNRTGIDTLSLFGVFYKHNMSDGFPLLTTKEVSWKNIVCENLWFLSGETKIDFLQKHGCKFWNPWANGNNEVPSAYGHFWRHFPTQAERPYIRDVAEVYNFEYFDQIKWVLEELRTNPNSRRLHVNAWSPGNACRSSLPPCHHSFTINVQGDRLNLIMHQRSCDVALGLPYNTAGYAFILSLFAHMSGFAAGEFAHAITDCHVYENHIEGLHTQLNREPSLLPKISIDSSINDLSDVEELIRDGTTEDILNTFKIHDYNPKQAIKFEVAV